MQYGWTVGPVIVVHEPTYRRDTLQARGDGPWLEPKPPPRGWIPLLSLLAVGVLAKAQSLPATLIVGGLAGAIGLVTWACEVHRRQTQVCPNCLRSVAEGATTCQCGFQEWRRSA